MTSTTRLATSLLLGLAITAGAHAATTPPSHTDTTQSTTAPFPAATLNEHTHALGNWQWGQSIDPYTGQPYPYASLRATASTTQSPTAVLSLLCSRYQTVVSVYWGQPVSGEHLLVEYTPRLLPDTLREYWIVSDHSPTLVYPRDGNELFDYLLASPTLSLTAFPEHGPNLVATFTTEGAATALKDLIRNCGT